MSSSTRRGNTSSKRFRAAILAAAEAIWFLSVNRSFEGMAACNLAEDLSERGNLCLW